MSNKLNFIEAFVAPATLAESRKEVLSVCINVYPCPTMGFPNRLYVPFGNLGAGKVTGGSRATPPTPGDRVHAAGGVRAIYFAGDTSVFSDMSLIQELYRPQLAMLPIGDLFTMGPRKAALARRLLQAETMIPMHFGTLPALAVGNRHCRSW